MQSVVEYKANRACPAGGAPCPRDVGQRTATTWTVKAPADLKLSLVRIKVGGTSVRAWQSGLFTWSPNVVPVRLLTRPRWLFQLGDFEGPDSPTVDREFTDRCDNSYCGIGTPPDYKPKIDVSAMWFWTLPGTNDVTITAQRENDDGTVTDVCKATRTYVVAPLNHDDPDRQAVDYYVNGGGAASFPDGTDVAIHARWHTTRDKQPYFLGEDWLAFHRMLVKSFDDWRAAFGYPPVTPWDGSTPVPVTDNGFDATDATRPDTNDGTFQPDCYQNGTGCAPEPWFTALGDGTSARGDDLVGGKCYYAPDRNGQIDEVPTGQRTLADFRDARGLGCVLNRTHHARMHAAVPGAFELIQTTPRDPLFWAYHKWVSGYGPGYVGNGTSARDAAATTESVLTAWERIKAQGPPGITAVFPPKGLAVATVPGIQVLFWEPVTGVAAADLTVNGSPATTVVGDGSEYVFSGFALPPSPPAGGSVPLAVELAAGAIQDLDGNPFPGDGWQYHLEHDQDGDGVPDDEDNCPDVANPDQTNTDALAGATFESHDTTEHDYGNGLGDALGDACDPDTDGDGIPDTVEIANGTDPLDWQDPYSCPLDPVKKTSGPGLCGCGEREVTSRAGQVSCEIRDPIPCAIPGFPGVSCNLDQMEETVGGAAKADLRPRLGTQLSHKVARLRKLVVKAQLVGKKGLKATVALGRQLSVLVGQLAKLPGTKIASSIRESLMAMALAAKGAIP